MTPKSIEAGGQGKTDDNLSLRLSPSLLGNVLDSSEFLLQYPYGCLEQRFSAMMPQVFLQQLYTALGDPFDLKTRFVDRWQDTDVGYTKVSYDTVIKEQLAALA